MKQRFLLLLFALLLTGILTAGVGEDFYSSALGEGQMLFREGQFAKALERLEFAAFGLMDRPELMKEVQAYSALTLFQLSRFDECREKLEQLSIRPAVLDPAAAGVAAGERDLFRVMLRTLFPSVQTEVGMGKRRAFELVFLAAWKAAREKEWSQVEAGIGKLSDLMPSDPRISLLQGMHDFAVQRFADACRVLEDQRTRIQPEFRDELLFVLIRACERVGHYGVIQTAMKEIQDPALRRSLEPVLAAVQERRARDVVALGRNFSRSAMRGLVSRFPGDHGLALQVWTAARQEPRRSAAALEKLLRELARFDEATDSDFFLQAADWLVSRKRVEQALKFLEKSPFAAGNSAANVKILYRLGRLYNTTGDTRRAEDIMQRILKIQPDHAAAREYLSRLEKQNNG